MLTHEEMWRQAYTNLDAYITTFMDSGDYWLLKSPQISVQARYEGLGGVCEVAVGGPFLQGHVFRVSHQASIHITWDGEPVLPSYPGPEFSDEQGLIRASFIDVSYGDEFWDGVGARSPALELTLPFDVRMTIVMPRACRMSPFLTMRKQEGGQDGQCGKAEGDDKVNMSHWRVDHPDSLLSPKMLPLEAQRAVAAHDFHTTHASSRRMADGGSATEGIDVDLCIEGAQEEFAEPCERVLNQTGNAIPMLFLEACKLDVCVGGPEMLAYTAMVASQVYQKVVAAAAGAALCEFAHPPGHSYIWDPTCSMGVLGCLADGKNIECRYCGFGPYESIPCR